MTRTSNTYRTGSIEYVTVQVTGRAADDASTPLTLDDQVPVKVSLGDHDAEGNLVLLDATWVGPVEVTASTYGGLGLIPESAWVPPDQAPDRPVDAWCRRRARTAEPVAFARSTSGPVLVHVGDNPEAPIIEAGYVSTI